MEIKDYTPKYNSHLDLKIIGTAKSDNGFTIYTQFYSPEEKPFKVTIDGKEYTEKRMINLRRVMVLEKAPNSNYLIISIDPIGKGASVYKKLDENLSILSRSTQININDFFDTIELEKAIFKLARTGKLVSKGLIAKEESTNRIKSIASQAASDDIKDDDIFDDCENDDLIMQNHKLKCNKENVEAFGKTLLKITTRMSKETTDELTENIKSVL